MPFRKRGKGFQPDSWCFTREMPAAPSCLCECGARDGLAQVWHTSGTRVVQPLHVPCRVGWRRSRAHAVLGGREPRRFLRAVAPLGLCAPRIGEAARAPAFPERSTLTAARIACSAISIRSTGWNSTTSILPIPTYPLVQTHGLIPKPMLDKLGIDERLLRLSVGLENAEDLIADLEQAIG